MLQRIKKSIHRHIAVYLAFFITLTVMLIAFAVNGMYPFGDYQVMVIDSWHQYYPFLQHFQEKLQTGGSLLYSKDLGLGTNFQLLMSYYAYSPLYFLSIFVPQVFLREFMLLTTIFRIALASAFFAIYLRYLFQKKDYTIAIFGSLYGLSAFALGYYWCLMWLDAFALLPLVILGMHKVLRGESKTLFIVSLAITCIANFYAAYLVCEFLVIYFFFLYFLRYRKNGIKGFLSSGINFAFTTFIALGIAAFVLVPTYNGLKLAYASTSNFPTDLRFYHNFVDIIRGLLPGFKVTVRAGLPNIYAGTLSIIMLVYYFLSKHIKLSEKIGHLGLLFFLLLGFNFRPLDYIWHAFHFPNEIPYRWSFIFSFVIVGLAFEGFLYFQKGESKAAGKILSLFLIFVFLSEPSIEKSVFFASIVLILTLGLILYVKEQREMAYSRFALLLTGVVVIEMLGMSIFGVATTGRSQRSTYPDKKDEIAELIKFQHSIDNKVQSGTKSIVSPYRSEMIKQYTTNDSVLYGYTGLNVFSSTANSNVSRFLQLLGLGADAPSNRYANHVGTPIVNGFMGLKYFYGRGDGFIRPSDAIKYISHSGKSVLYENNFSLPFAFFVSKDIDKLEFSNSSKFEIQTKLLNLASGSNETYFEKINPSKITYERVNESTKSGNKYHFVNSGQTQGTITLDYEFDEDTQVYIYHFSNASYTTVISSYPNGKKASPPSEDEVKIDERGLEVDKYNIQDRWETRRGLTMDAGKVYSGGNIQVVFDTLEGQSGYFEHELVAADLGKLKESLSKLSANPLVITKYTDTHIIGDIVAPESGYIYTSIPFEAGWKLKVNEKETPIHPFKNAFIFIPVNAGQNHIELTYSPAGFSGGVMISIASLILAIVVITTDEKTRMRRIRQKKENKEMFVGMTISESDHTNGDFSSNDAPDVSNGILGTPDVSNGILGTPDVSTSTLTANDFSTGIKNTEESHSSQMFQTEDADDLNAGVQTQKESYSEGSLANTELGESTDTPSEGNDLADSVVQNTHEEKSNQTD